MMAVITAALLIGIAVFAALAWGSNEPWSMALIAVLSLSLLALRLAWDAWRGTLKIPRDAALLALALFLLYAGFQAAYASVERHSSVLYLLLGLSCFSVIYLAQRNYGGRAGAKLILVGVLVLGAFEACYGLVQYLGDINSIWGHTRTAYHRLATGTLINRNHYALLMNCCICSGVGFLYYRSLRLLRTDRISLRLIAGSPHTGALAWIVLWIALMGVALVFSMSRMGIAAMFCSVSAMAILAKAAQPRIRATVIGLSLVFAILGLAVYVGVDEVLVRFEGLSEERESDLMRIGLWRDALKMIRSQSWFGTGLGTFQWTYPAYESIEPDRPARYAHNDYLQVLAETGIAGLGLMLWFFAALWRTALKNLRNDRDPLVRGVGLGTLGMLTAIALQEMTDFGLYIPGVAVTAALVAGVNVRMKALARE